MRIRLRWRGQSRAYQYTTRFLSGLTACCLLLALAGCDVAETPHGVWVRVDLQDTGNTSASTHFDEKVQHVETSAIPGATAKLFAAAPGASSAGPPANFCVTDAGFCPLAAAVPAGRNCLCQAGNLMYGGATGVPPQYNYAENP